MPAIALTAPQRAALWAMLALEPTPECLPSSVEALSLIEELVAYVDDDAALLMLISPILQRRLHPRPTPDVPAALTVQERRVLMLVANGMSNSEIAGHLFVSVATVRKHLENSYRKLGVHNRMAAVVAFEGGPTVHRERIELVQKFA
jgi:DNA-binding NarL/FixJ family response regulator